MAQVFQWSSTKWRKSTCRHSSLARCWRQAITMIQSVKSQVRIAFVASSYNTFVWFVSTAIFKLLNQYLFVHNALMNVLYSIVEYFKCILSVTWKYWLRVVLGRFQVEETATARSCVIFSVRSLPLKRRPKNTANLSSSRGLRTWRKRLTSQLTWTKVGVNIVNAGSTVVRVPCMYTICVIFQMQHFVKFVLKFFCF